MLTDILLLAISFFVVLAWFPLTTQIPFQKYNVFGVIFSAAWLISNYLCHRYVRVKLLELGLSVGRLLLASFVTFGMMMLYMDIASGNTQYSIVVLLTILLIMLTVSVIYLFLHHAYKYATMTEVQLERAPERGPTTVLRPAQQVDEDYRQEIAASVIGTVGDEAWKYLKTHVDFYSTNTLVMRTGELFNFQQLMPFRYDVLINLLPLNHIHGINQMFGQVNDRLPDDGMWICCFESHSSYKRRFLAKYPPVINQVFYFFNYLYKRVLPHLMLTRRMYFEIIESDTRVLSHAEVLGRLCYCGFSIVDTRRIGDLTYVIARRQFRPKTVETRLYGVLVGLDRHGRDGRMFRVYKFRTMHPYSEFLQQYIYDKYHLAAGGKFNHDIRVTTRGKMLRRYWLDELPMVINLLRGEMKLVGVRPISDQYFRLYSAELQEKRNQHKPGLLPPFYADMPNTLEEIEASEMRYLVSCEQKGTLRTDFCYFWKIIFTILFKRARSH